MENKEFVLDQVTIKKLLTIYKLKIPDFQRSFVWKKGKKQQLLESLFRGFPIGAITLYEDEGAYYIIDGLQRINTLNQYLSCPSKIIPFEVFYEKVSFEVEPFLRTNKLLDCRKQVEKCIKIWYEKLDKLYEFEKVSVLNSILMVSSSKVADVFRDLAKVEELLDILKRKIEIVHDDVALIIYRGNKEDLPDLFKNINTGSVALSQYEILQSVWMDKTLKKEWLKDTCSAFNRELELLKGDYEIQAIRDEGSFDIFKNIMGLNHLICCNKDCDVVFRFPGFKKNVIRFEDGEIKYFDNDSIAFEIYSTILCGASNQIVKAVDLLYLNHQSVDEISRFLAKLNQIILVAIDTAIEEINKKDVEMIGSKYHSLYVLMGIVRSKYAINVEKLTIQEIPVNMQLYLECLDLVKHRKEKWFLDENRQVSFFKSKIEDLLALKQKICPEEVSKKGVMRIKINDKVIEKNTVKDFYSAIFELLLELGVKLDDFLPYATGNKRYLVNRTGKHINGESFFSPLYICGFYVEAHKSKSDAIKDIYHFLQTVGVDVECIN